jgi:hypothetical protein
MLSTLIGDPTMASPQLSSPIGRLPRELRDYIYDLLFHETPYLIQRFSSYDTNTVPPTEEKILAPYHPYYESNLLYLRYRHRCNTQESNRPGFPTESTYPEWVRTCRLFAIEGMDVFIRNAEWYFDGYCLGTGLVDHWTNRLFQLDTSNVTTMHLYVNNLANFEQPFRYEGTNSRADMEYFAKLMRTTDMKLKEMRFVGHSYHFHIGAETCYGQAHNMMRNLVSIFHSIGVSDWSFGIVEPNRAGLWVLYDWIVPAGREEVDGRLELIVRELPQAGQ